MKSALILSGLLALAAAAPSPHGKKDPKKQSKSHSKNTAKAPHKAEAHGLSQAEYGGDSQPVPGGGWTDDSAGQIPFEFPLSNGFPNISVPSDELLEIYSRAQGTLPNGALPSEIADDTALTLQLVAFNEFFEVAFFTSLLANITNGQPGFDVASGSALEIVVNALVAVQAQEELHAIGANAILASAGRTPIDPCAYVFVSAIPRIPLTG